METVSLINTNKLLDLQMWLTPSFLTRSNYGVVSRIDDVSTTFVITDGSLISEETRRKCVRREALQRKSVIDRNVLEGINSTYCAQYETRQLLSATISIVLLDSCNTIVQKHDRHENDKTGGYIQMHFFFIERYENKNVFCKLQYLMAIKYKSVCIKHLRWVRTRIWLRTRINYSIIWK